MNERSITATPTVTFQPSVAPWAIASRKFKVFGSSSIIGLSPTVSGLLISGIIILAIMIDPGAAMMLAART